VGVGPQIFQTVIVAFIRRKNVYHQIAKVNQNPTAFWHAFYAGGYNSGLFLGLGTDTFCQGADLPVIVTVTN